MSFLKSAAGAAFRGKMTNLWASSSVDSISGVSSSVQPRRGSREIRGSQVDQQQLSKRQFIQRYQPHPNAFLHNYQLLFCQKKKKTSQCRDF